MAYDVNAFHSVVPRERPDFALQFRDGDLPFGVEITQLFPDESHARLNLVDGYAQQLWSGGPHIHKKDISRLRAETVVLQDKDGNIKDPAVPAIIMVPPTTCQFLDGLRTMIEEKGAKGYDGAGLSHIDLVIFDWFRLPFDRSDYSSGRFLDGGVREALKASPFREVFLIMQSTKRDVSSTGRRGFRACLVPLQQLLITERFFVTFHSIAERLDDSAEVEEANRLAVDHVSRVQGIGGQVVERGLPMVHYRSSVVAADEKSVQILYFGHFGTDSLVITHVTDRLEPGLESEVTAAAEAGELQTALTLPANLPSIWVGE